MNFPVIISDTADIIAVNKPAGYLTIPGRTMSDPRPILINWIRDQLKMGERNIHKNDLWILHRLDEGTSGVVLFAKNSETHKKLSKLFENDHVKKTYLAVTCGIPKTDLIDAPIRKLSHGNKNVVSDKGKPSQTRISIISKSEKYCLLKVEPLTGRTHQIRVHLKHINCPILGDQLYGDSKEKTWPMLHAQSISFEIDGQKHQYTAPLPLEWGKTLTDLGLSLV